MPDLDDHPFSPRSVARESGAADPNERAWLKWVKAAESALGHSLDGDEKGCGYSLDEAFEAFAQNVPAEGYAQEVMERPRYAPPEPTPPTASEMFNRLFGDLFPPVKVDGPDLSDRAYTIWRARAEKLFGFNVYDDLHLQCAGQGEGSLTSPKQAFRSGMSAEAYVKATTSHPNFVGPQLSERSKASYAADNIMLDVGLTAEQLREKYDDEDGWGEFPEFTMDAWREEVANGDTRSGYWDWVVSQLEQVAAEAEMADDLSGPSP